MRGHRGGDWGVQSDCCGSIRNAPNDYPPLPPGRTPCAARSGKGAGHGDGRAERPRLDQAGPVSFSGSATTTASPEAVFAILADHERWPEWFPVLKKEEVLGPRREGVGTRRLATIPGGKIEELIIAWDPGQRFAFTATVVSPGSCAPSSTTVA